MKISIIGVGRLGGALALALSEAGCEIENLAVRKPAGAEKIARHVKAKILSSNELDQIASDVIFIAAQDFEIEAVAENLAENLNTRPTVFHTSGSLSSEILERLKKKGCPAGSFHPLVSVSDARLGKERFKGAYFCVEGDRQATETAKKIVKKLKGKAFSVETKYKRLYHASAVTACGHLVALVDVAVEMLSKCGLSRTRAREILLPLIESTVENLKTQTPVQALTGTFARADVETFKKHLEVLRRNVSPEALETFLQLGERSAHLAEEQGASRENLEKMRKEILLAKNSLK